MEQPVKSRTAGFLVPVLMLCLAFLSAGYLAATAYCARLEDQAEEKKVQLAAYYAAESGVIWAEEAVRSRDFKPPQAGPWSGAGLNTSGQARFQVTVTPDELSEQAFTIDSTGQAFGERSRIFTSTLRARFQKRSGRWSLDWCRVMVGSRG